MFKPLSSLIALALAVTPVAARQNVSQHPRVGQLAEIAFQRGSDSLPIGVERELGEIAAWAKENPEGLIVIEGHTDREGDFASNLALSFERADAVVVQLLTLGIPREQIVIAGFGQTSNGRRVLVWSTRAGLDVVEDRLRARGAKEIRSSNLLG
jgi:outer membrane protein OmpA-like peptidoglycan-associated protein